MHRDRRKGIAEKGVVEKGLSKRDYRMPNNNAMPNNNTMVMLVRRHNAGLTIIEMLMVMALIAIMAGIGLLHINSAGFRLQSEARNIRTALFDARYEAIKRNVSQEMRLFTDRYVNHRGETIRLEGGMSLIYSGGGALPPGGAVVSFTPLSTASNSHFHLRHSAGGTINILISPIGRIWLERRL